jgi:hypothetical protein
MLVKKERAQATLPDLTIYVGWKVLAVKRGSRGLGLRNRLKAELRTAPLRRDNEYLLFFPDRSFGMRVADEDCVVGPGCFL